MSRLASMLLVWMVIAGGGVAEAGRDRVVVVVIKPGKAPQRALRYRVAPAKQVMVVRSEIDLESIMGGARQNLVVPTTELRVAFDIGAPAKGIDQGWRPAPQAQRRPPENTSVPYTVEVTGADAKLRPGAPASTLAAMKKALVKIVGLRGSGRTSDRGVGGPIQWSKTGIGDPRLKSMLASAVAEIEQPAIPWPSAAVGVGAVWQVRTVVRRRGMRVVQTATYELLRSSGKRGTIRVRMSQTAPRQRIDLPGVTSDENRPTLIAYHAHGKGTIEFDLGRLVARTEVAMKLDYTMRARIQNAQRDVQSKLDVRIKIAPE